MKKLFAFLRGSTLQKPIQKERGVISCLKPSREGSHEEAAAVSKEITEKKPIPPTSETQKELSAGDPWRILERVFCNDPRYAEAFEKVLPTLSTLEDFDSLHQTIDDDGGDEFVEKLVARMKELKFKESFDEWVEMYSNQSDLGKYSDALLDQAIHLAESTEEWISLWEAAENSHDDDLTTVKSALSQVEWDEEEWKNFRDETSDDGMENFAFTQILKFYDTVPSILRFYLDYQDGWSTDDAVVEVIFKKLFSTATRQEVQLIRILTEDDELESAAKKFLMS